MDRSRLKRACVRAFPITAACFILSIVILSVVHAILGWMIEPMIIVGMIVMFAIIGILNIVRMYIDESRWALSRPYIVKNFIFMPFYFIVALVFAVSVFGSFDLLTAGICSAIFLTVFMVIQTIIYFCSRRTTDRMNNALLNYQKEHLGDEQE